MIDSTIDPVAEANLNTIAAFIRKAEEEDLLIECLYSALGDKSNKELEKILVGALMEWDC